MREPTAQPRRLRDVSDVDAYVSEAMGALAPRPANPAALHAEGVRAVRRLERALPPEKSLAPVLDEVLPPHLAALDRVFARRERIRAAA